MAGWINSLDEKGFRQRKEKIEGGIKGLFLFIVLNEEL